MLGEHLSAQRHGLLGADGAVGPHFHGQLIVVGDLTDTGVLHRVVDLENRGVDGIHRDNADDRSHLLLIPLGRDIAAALIQGDFHIQLGTLAQRGDVHVGLENLHLAVAFDGAGRDFAGAFRFNIYNLGAVAVDLDDQTLDVQYNFGNVLFHTLDGGKFVEDAVDFHGGHRHAGQGGQQHAAQAVSQSGAIAPLKGFHDKLPVRAVGRKVHGFNSGLLNLNHSKPSL